MSLPVPNYPAAEICQEFCPLVLLIALVQMHSNARRNTFLFNWFQICIRRAIFETSSPLFWEEKTEAYSCFLIMLVELWVCVYCFHLWYFLHHTYDRTEGLRRAGGSCPPRSHIEVLKHFQVGLQETLVRHLGKKLMEGENSRGHLPLLLCFWESLLSAGGASPVSSTTLERDAVYLATSSEA